MNQKIFTVALVGRISQIIFRALVLAFFLIAIAEYVEPGFITNWFNPVWLLPWMVVSAILPTSTRYD